MQRVRTVRRRKKHKEAVELGKNSPFASRTTQEFSNHRRSMVFGGTVKVSLAI